MIRQKLGAYFPFNFRIAGFIISIIALILAWDILVYTNLGINSILGLMGTGLLMFPLGLILITAHKGIQIDVKHKTIKEYVWLLGFKAGKPVSFNYISKIYINRVNDAGVFTSRAGLTHKIDNWVFKAFIKIDMGEKFHLGSSKNQEELKKRINSCLVILGELYQPEEST